jgi:hypothetical protein
MKILNFLIKNKTNNLILKFIIIHKIGRLKEKVLIKNLILNKEFLGFIIFLIKLKGIILKLERINYLIKIIRILNII